MKVFLKSLFLTLTLSGLLACGAPPAPTGSSPDSSPDSESPSTEGAPEGSGSSSEAEEPAVAPVGETEASSRAPEFRAIRGAIQPINELKSAAGKRMADSCMKAELAVGAGSAAVAEKHLKSILQSLDKSDLSAVPDRTKAAFYAAYAKDLGALGSRKGAPKLKITTTKDRLCGKGGACSEVSAGALCYTATFSDGDTSCGCAPAGSIPSTEEPAAAMTKPAKAGDAKTKAAAVDAKAAAVDAKAAAVDTKAAAVDAKAAAVDTKAAAVDTKAASKDKASTATTPKAKPAAEGTKAVDKKTAPAKGSK